MNAVIVWGPYSPNVKWSFGRTYYLHLQGRKSVKQEIGVGRNSTVNSFIIGTLGQV
jgi:hypothetical protein